MNFSTWPLQALNQQAEKNLHCLLDTAKGSKKPTPTMKQQNVHTRHPTWHLADVLQLQISILGLAAPTSGLGQLEASLSIDFASSLMHLSLWLPPKKGEKCEKVSSLKARTWLTKHLWSLQNSQDNNCSS